MRGHPSLSAFPSLALAPQHPCLSPWQPNRAVPTFHHTAPWLHPLLKGAQLDLLWGGWHLIRVPSGSNSPRPGGQGQVPPTSTCQEHSRHLFLASFCLTRPQTPLALSLGFSAPPVQQALEARAGRGSQAEPIAEQHHMSQPRGLPAQSVAQRGSHRRVRFLLFM